MKRNMGNLDRIIRAIAGIILLVLGIMYVGAWWGIVLLVVGIILLATAIIGFCPLYTLCHCSTQKK
jgi:hypothetical protein